MSYKLKVLETVEALKEQGEGTIGAYLRKEGLYYSSIRYWARLRDNGLLTGNSKGPKENNRDKLLAENKQLRRQLEQTKKRLAKTEMLIELQKKLSVIMGIDDPTNTGRSDEK